VGIDQDEVREAAAFAVKQEGAKGEVAIVLKAIVDSQKQIVAGTNYRLVLLVEKDGEKKQARTTVFRGLDQHYELKQWEWMKEAENLR
jgi:Aspartic acid proteinase inhibitor